MISQLLHMDAVLHARPIRGELHIQCGTYQEVATLILWKKEVNSIKSSSFVFKAMILNVVDVDP